MLSHFSLFHLVCKITKNPAHFSNERDKVYVNDSKSTLLKTNLSFIFFIKPFIVTMTNKHGEHILTLTMQDIVDGIVAGDILYLTTTEVVL